MAAAAQGYPRCRHTRSIACRREFRRDGPMLRSSVRARSSVSVCIVCV